MLAFFIITIGILSRLIIHTPNFTPVLSMAFLSGMYLKGRKAIWIPLALMVGSDFIIGFYPGMIFTWGSMVFISLLGLALRNQKGFVSVFSGSLLSAVIFFLVSNFGAWIYFYPHTVAGLKACYVLAIPFFRSSLVSTIGYTLAFFAGYEWLIKRAEGTKVLARLL
ncbi:MAG: hypothetical protein HQL13_00235 [Candidatus Omnitrophica bacterium]|nr:hypothetical protein [Candidatus Omnitrophota bacterium]